MYALIVPLGDAGELRCKEHLVHRGAIRRFFSHPVTKWTAGIVLASAAGGSVMIADKAQRFLAFEKTETYFDIKEFATHICKSLGGEGSREKVSTVNESSLNMVAYEFKGKGKSVNKAKVILEDALLLHSLPYLLSSSRSVTSKIRNPFIVLNELGQGEEGDSTTANFKKIMSAPSPWANEYEGSGYDKLHEQAAPQILPLIEWLLDQPKNSVSHKQMFDKSLQIYEGNALRALGAIAYMFDEERKHLDYRETRVDSSLLGSKLKNIFPGKMDDPIGANYHFWSYINISLKGYGKAADLFTRTYEAAIQNDKEDFSADMAGLQVGHSLRANCLQ